MTKKRAKISNRTLKAGHYGERVVIADYGDYLRALKEAEESKAHIVAYSIGVNMTREDDGSKINAIIFPLADLKLIRTEKEFDDEIQAFIESKTYGLEVDSFFIHFAFAKEYARKKHAAALKKKAKKERHDKLLETLKARREVKNQREKEKRERRNAKRRESRKAKAAQR